MITFEIEKNSKELLDKLATLSESELSDLVIFHNRQYFERNDPKISDETFDKLIEALRFKNPQAEALFRIGHKDIFSANLKFGDDVIHDRPMLSLEKCYDDANFFKWSTKISGDFIAMPKIDGVACSVIYSAEGALLQVATRGDGHVGENVTKNALSISDLPAQLPEALVKKIVDAENFLEIRGEIFLPVSQFYEKFASSFSSPRNLAAGFLKLKETDPSKNNFLRFFPYDLRGTTAKSEEEKFLLLGELGFSMMPWQVVKNDQQATEIYFDFLKRRASFDYEIDGAVYRANSLTEQRRLGETAHHPRFALAYKFHGESAQTKLLFVEWSVARSGIITPVALFEPVFVSGASVARASLHNLRIFSELDLHEESLLEINRRGGVIPYLERVLSRKGNSIPIPKNCPSCAGEVIIEGDFLRCKSPGGCEEIAVSKFIHFCHVLGIEGLGEKIIRRLYQAKMLHQLGDIFRLTEDKLLTLERMGSVLAQKLLKEIERKRNIPLPLFIQALGIREIGGTISELLAQNFRTLFAVRSLTPQDLLAIHGIGISIATSLIEGFEENENEIDDLLTEINVLEEESPSVRFDHSHPLYQKSVLFTGKMAHLDRKAAQEAVKKIGGKAPGAISKSIDFLVIGDEGSSLLGQGKKSTKQKEAENLIAEGAHLKIISETDFLKLLGKEE